MNFEKTLQNLNIKVYLDGADLDSIKEYSSMNVIHGFTSNPSLMSQSNISNYEDFIINTLSLINDKPISFEVVEDENSLIVEQAKEYQVCKKYLCKNTNSQHQISTCNKRIKRIIPLNITAILDKGQVLENSKISNLNQIYSQFLLVELLTRVLKEVLNAKNNYKTLWVSPMKFIFV